MAISIDQTDPKKLVLTLRYLRHPAGAFVALIMVGGWYAALLHFGDRYIPGYEDIRSPVAWLFLITPLAVLPALLRNLRWALFGEKFVFDGHTADVLLNGRVLCEWKDVQFVSAHIGTRRHMMFLQLASGKEVLVGDGTDQESIEKAGRSAAALLRKPYRAGSL